MALRPARQQGYVLLAFVALLSVVTFSFVVGYSTVLAKKEVAALLTNQKAFIASAASQVEAAYVANLAEVDGTTTSGSFRNPSQFLSLAGITPKWGMQAAVSNVLSARGVAYTVVALWIPTSTDTQNPPSFDATTGTFNSCPNAAAPCAPRAYALVSGLTLQQQALQSALQQLNDLAAKEQEYFKAKALFDPDHDIGINYFRAPDGNCDDPNQMPCIDQYTAVGSTAVPPLLGIPASTQMNPWGLPLETSNLQDSSSAAPPYSMAFRTSTPWGASYTVLALQPI
ncbi:hypothetical protein F6X40_16990 [Paraburkholderia sp. UCT31]|uniref:hypothetical protein n=1 Tax=Paraburkholderia sp. UCT31 TaxID=2615209 RepID=UPI00165648F8|nr:hypothetical protein [Paraburkholderia sp. UCT31]MBC8738473.1 hypothetical protein [Paraburkholderia sp. UCT31]